MKARDGCTGKKRHRNRHGANIHLKALNKPGMHAYKCPRCQGWHIGHDNWRDGLQERFDRLIGPDPKTLRSVQSVKSVDP